MTVSTDAVRARLEASRKELLDLGLRNPLLNYRPPRSRGVVVVDELPEQVYRMLVAESRKLSFLPAADEAAEGLLGQPPEPTDAATPGKALPRHTDTRLQTGQTGPRLQAALLATHLGARAFIEEQGANVLYVALGMLEWLEPGNKNDPRRAPLILVPVEIARASAQSRFHIGYSGEDLGENLSLAARLKADYNLVLPALPAAEDLDPKQYFDDVAALVADQPGWKVDREAVVLGFFAFGKFLMYRDLDPEVWPLEAAPSSHPILKALLASGFSEPAAPLAEDALLDDRLAPGDPPTVVDADSTQILAVVGARGGRNLVIQGPPGTGKSQTITNLIADALARGRTVLFVAEKQAALEVVKRRLDAVGLGDACLELHSHKASKKAVLAELRRTLDLGRPRTSPELEDDLHLYAELRDHLNATCHAINAPVGETGVSPFQALGALVWDVRRGAAPALEPPIDGLAGWSAADWRRRLAMVERLEGVIEAMGSPARHPFRRASLQQWGPTAARGVREAVARARAATVALQGFSQRLAPRLAGVPIPTSAVELDRLANSLARLADPPPLPGMTLDAPEWLQRHDDLRRLTAAGARLAELRRGLDALVVPEAWEENLLDTKLQLAAHGRKVLRLLNADYRRALATLNRLCRGKPPTTLEGRLALLDRVQEAARHRSLVRDLQGLGETAFWPHWKALDSDWDAFERATGWLHDLNVDLAEERLVPQLPAAFAAHPHGVPAPAELGEARVALLEHARAWEALKQALAHLDELGRLTFEAQLALLDPWEQEAERLSELVSYNQLAVQLQGEGLGPVVALAMDAPPRGELVRAVSRAWYEAVLERALLERSPLAGFGGASQEIEITRFRELDVAIGAYHRATLALKHHEALPGLRAGGGGASQLAVLQRELEKKSRLLPLRQLLSRAGNAVQHVKPVFMMSPLSIATFLAPDGPRFDLVVFDEASQVRPVDALGAIARGRQLVVVGDKRQMPPTDFFDTQLRDDAPADDDTATRDYESVLGLMEAQGAPQHMLRWHYRSRHESLIAVSNQAFYDGKLVVFPSPDAARTHAGLRLHYLAEAVYERGSSRTNPAEARAVAEAVLAHAREHPELSLGVAAFGVAQMQAIQAAVEVARREDPSVEPFFGAHPHEPFFVKNLETVQGDERDVMILSTAYGRDAQGKLALNFGPLNLEGGERRLNVLITRARLRCEVFTSLRAEDLPDEPSTPSGVAALRAFLAYAAAGPAADGHAAAEAVEAGLVRAIAAELGALGYDSVPGVGGETFYLDLAVRDPREPGRYLLGVMLDGPGYAGARAARDRDRLRAQVLSGLGWQLHRVWSVDWHNRPQAELKRLVAALEAAREVVAQAAPPPMPAAEPPIERSEPVPAPAPTRVAPYEFAQLDVQAPAAGLPGLPTNLLARHVVEVVTVESPVAPAEVIKRIATAAGVKRAGAKVVAALEGAIEHALKAGQIEQRGEFLWAPAMEVAPIRDRTAIPAAQRKLELIAPEERLRAVEKAVADGFGLEPEAAALAAAKLLGYSRPNDEVLSGLREAVESALGTGRLVYQGSQLVLLE